MAGARRFGHLRNVTLTDDVCLKIKAPTALIGLSCDRHIARDRFLKRQRTTSDNEERFERKLKEHDEHQEVILPHYSKINFQVSLDKKFSTLVSWVTWNYNDGAEMLMERQMHVNSGQDGWINGVLDLLQGEFKELVALTGSLEGQ